MSKSVLYGKDVNGYFYPVLVDSEGNLQIDVLSLPQIDVSSLPAIPFGTNDIGNVGNIFDNISILPSASRTTSGDTSSSPIFVGKYKEGVFFLDVASATGTSPTLDVIIKTKDPISGKWFDLVTFTQATGVVSEMKTSGYLGSEIAVFYTIGGDTPDFTFSLGAVFKS
jgi:hypothetical protein